jgi:phage FluMu protein Com
MALCDICHALGSSPPVEKKCRRCKTSLIQIHTKCLENQTRTDLFKLKCAKCYHVNVFTSVTKISTLKDKSNLKRLFISIISIMAILSVIAWTINQGSNHSYTWILVSIIFRLCGLILLMRLVFWIASKLQTVFIWPFWLIFGAFFRTKVIQN